MRRAANIAFIASMFLSAMALGSALNKAFPITTAKHPDERAADVYRMYVSHGLKGPYPRLEAR